MNMNEGKILKQITSLLGTLSMILSSIVSIWIMAELELVLLGFGILIVCWFITTTIMLFVNAFATLVDKTCLIESYLRTTSKEDESSDFLNNFLKNTNSKSNESISSDQDSISSQPAKTNTFLPDKWICRTCGKINKNFVDTCGCGQLKFENGEWVCSKCGKCNERNIGICDCGQLKSNNQ